MSKKKTKEEFLLELYEKCLNYRNGEFEVLGEYRKNDIPIIIKNKYGYLKVRPSDILRKCLKFKTNSAIFKDNYFRELLREKSCHYRKGSYVLASEYKGVKEVIYVKNKYGIMKSTPADLLSGRNPSIISAVDIDSYVVSILLDKNDDYKSGNFTIIKGYTKRDEPLILQDKYGQYTMKLPHLMTNSKIWLPSAINLSENIVNRLQEVNGNRYNYSEIKNISGAGLEKLKIICRIHGLFEQGYFHHKNGSGCPKCGKLSAIEILKNNPSGWSHADWVKTAEKSENFDSFKTYILKFSDKFNDETFYKIGRTFLTLRLRFNSINKYYNIIPIKIFEDVDPKIIIQKEIELLRLNKENRYTPSRFFHGRNECFSKVEYEYDKNE